MRAITRYLGRLSTGRVILWCYLIWYAVIAVRYFDPSPALWATSAGLAVIIGLGLWINATRSGDRPIRIGFWPTARLFMMPFCVSSFAALVKGRGFILIFSRDWRDLAWGITLCALFCLLVAAGKFLTGFGSWWKI